MKLVKKIAFVTLAVMAFSGCTKSSVSTEAPVAEEIPAEELTEEEIDFDEVSMAETKRIDLDV